LGKFDFDEFMQDGIAILAGSSVALGRMLPVIAQLKQASRQNVTSTFLGSDSSDSLESCRREIEMLEIVQMQKQAACSNQIKSLYCHCRNLQQQKF
jgi:hypothetical protein